MSALATRLMRLERVLPLPDKSRAALVIVHGSGRDADNIVAVHGLDLRRLPDESAGQFIERVETHVRATRGRSLPLVTFAVYADDDE